MSEINEDQFAEDDDESLHMDDDYVLTGGCNCEWCVERRKELEDEAEESERNSSRPLDFISGIMEKEQIQHKFFIERENTINDKIKLAMSFIEQQGVASIVVTGEESHRLPLENGAEIERKRALSAVFNFITDEFTKKRK